VSSERGFEVHGGAFFLDVGSSRRAQQDLPIECASVLCRWETTLLLESRERSQYSGVEFGTVRCEVTGSAGFACFELWLDSKIR
jgi:hypothetical protein